LRQAWLRTSALVYLPALGTALALGLAAAPLVADTILLKNGKRIVATAVREEGARITYETADGEYALPRSLVERIEKGGEASSRPSRAVEMPLPAVPAAPASGKPPVLPSGEVDRPYLEALATQPNLDEAGKHKLAALFLAAMDYEMRRNRTDAALALAERAVSVVSQDPQLMLAHGVLLLHKQQYQAARDRLNRARLAAPDSALVWKFLGFAEYFSDRTDDAIRSWRKSLSLAPDAEVTRMLERAQRETSAEANFEQAASSHFTLRFEGRQVVPAFRREILEVLEHHYQDLDRQLDASLREPIPVILYTSQAFRDVTRAPAWVGALNDGRMRVPVEGLSSVTSDLSRVLKHELVHSMVWAKTHGRCPTWLNEGLAQLLEGSSIRGDRRLAELWESGRRLPWSALQGSFTGLGPGMAALAYTQSLAATEYLTSLYGPHELVRLLGRLDGGQSIEAALGSVYRLDYAELDRGIVQWLRSSR